MIGDNILVGGYSVITAKGSSIPSVDERKLPKENNIDRLNNAVEWALWGSNNNLPLEIIDAIQKDEVIFQSNEFNKASHYGNGLNYYKEIRTKGGMEKDYTSIAEVDDWIEENNANALFLEFIEDYESLGNRVPAMILNRGRNYIARMERKQASWCRWKKQNPDTRKIETLLYNSDWRYMNKEWIQEIPVLNVFDPINDLLARAEKGKAPEFIYRTKCFTSNRYYYDLANVEVLINSGNLEMIDMLKAAYKSLTKNSLGVAWHIEPTEDYCKRRVSASDLNKWETDAAFRTTILNAIKKEVDDWLTGPENQGKSLLVPKFRNPRTGEFESGITITQLDDKIKQDKWLPNMQQYHAENYRAMGVDPSNTGISNKNDGMNSGSEKKNAFFNQKATLGIDRIHTLMPFQFVARFNQWTKKYKGFKWEVIDEYPHLDITPNSNKSTQKPTNTSE